MFQFVVRHFGFLKNVPLLPHVFESLLKLHTFILRSHLLDAFDHIEAEVMRWDGTTICMHKYGGMQFNVAKKEIGHLHGNGILDVLYSRKVKTLLVEEGKVTDHHTFKKSGWVSFQIVSPEDTAYAIKLLKLSYSMKRFLIFLILLVPAALYAQKPTAQYVKALYKKYPTQKSDLCPSCLLWVNPYFKSIGDTVDHKPVLTYYVYTKAHRIEQEKIRLPRTGANAAWHSVYGQPNETAVYKEANRIIGKPNSAEMISKGHCQAWILMAWNQDAAILSNTYTFNAGMQYQGQNTGTQFATEELCRMLTGYKTNAVTDSVKIWCGTFGSQATYKKQEVKAIVPEYYYKVIEYNDKVSGTKVTQCYWMPNRPDAKRASLISCQISYAELTARLGFDPRAIFNEY
ncbi:luciferase domain-containing protein [Pedobacter faecalis]|uniref:luciferase domain-containing protein n=1 Tax=Pedobacter faecalis TaxID=3041495 RepID=UPI002549F260|nr:luciferase family protein [Pedobacter sp. ELA7]